MDAARAAALLEGACQSHRAPEQMVTWHLGPYDASHYRPRMYAYTEHYGLAGRGGEGAVASCMSIAIRSMWSACSGSGSGIPATIRYVSTGLVHAVLESEPVENAEHIVEHVHELLGGHVGAHFGEADDVSEKDGDRVVTVQGGLYKGPETMSSLITCLGRRFRMMVKLILISCLTSTVFMKLSSSVWSKPYATAASVPHTDPSDSSSHQGAQPMHTRVTHSTSTPIPPTPTCLNRCRSMPETKTRDASRTVPSAAGQLAVSLSQFPL
eukprot:CAMPEP_0177690458 /NCGR_PEP_ID=MMETSP0484_2-20121128/777_1 /TAXON_ID=354590 /ORGANISM="Rhodomonas lens, Strain RHODO" /LENGTH=267 /DNA_ID=CAMNT_0019201003 /DNA_START=149 /DNA_END=951 /DNA_ORIENTATION=+